MQEIAVGYIQDKMHSTLGSPVEYQLILDSIKLPLNGLIGQKLKIEYLGESKCLHCSDPRVFNQGYCFRCTQKLPQCDFCILSPDKCHFDQGTCRDEQFAQSHCFIPHLVYLSYSSHVKVGLTRKGNEKTRWIDQGAVAGLPILELRNRRAAGKIESMMKNWFSDRTSWQKMLKEEAPNISALLTARHEALAKLDSMGLESLHREAEGELKILSDEEPTQINFPVQVYPEKVRSVDLKKVGSIADRLVGIKGQYLIFENAVMNLRKYQGFQVKIGAEPKIS